MHDIKDIRDDPGAFNRALARRGLPACAATIFLHDKQWRKAVQREQDQKTEGNRLAREIGQRKQAGEPVDDLMAAAAKLKMIDMGADDLRARLDQILNSLPNLPAPECPDGGGESTVVTEYGEIPGWAMEPKSHEQLGEDLQMMRLDQGVKLAGPRFSVLHGPLARLERALGQFMLDRQIELGFREVSVPLLVNEKAVYGTGQLPNFADDMFRTTEGKYLIPTAEVPLTNLVADQIFDEEDLPRRYCALTPCFRSEAGAAGRDTAGILRQHQFYKVELVTVCLPEQSPCEHEDMLAAAEQMLRLLRLPFRTILLPANDMGFAARKTYDIEVWMPSQKWFREISSVSNCGDFQARRMNARFRRDRKVHFVHTLNGSGLAVGRTLIALMENNQRMDGSIDLPAVLHPYMGGQSRLVLP